MPGCLKSERGFSLTFQSTFGDEVRRVLDGCVFVWRCEVWWSRNLHAQIAGLIKGKQWLSQALNI